MTEENSESRNWIRHTKFNLNKLTWTWHLETSTSTVTVVRVRHSTSITTASFDILITDTLVTLATHSSPTFDTVSQSLTSKLGGVSILRLCVADPFVPNRGVWVVSRRPRTMEEKRCVSCLPVSEKSHMSSSCDTKKVHSKKSINWFRSSSE